jgi:hypothetical protein
MALCKDDVTKCIVMMQIPVVSPFFWTLPLNSIPHILEKVNIKSEIHCLSYWDKLTVTFSFGVMYWCVI